ncbi:MAG: hypothetical protein HWN68_10440 [Desulfobacterales bacterium]|nr:hypothetical protein [Desulfobacterales bacterium]
MACLTHKALFVAIAVILSAVPSFSLSTYAEDAHPEEARSEDLQCKDCHGKDRFLPSYHKVAGKWKKTHGHRTRTLVTGPRVKTKIALKPGHMYDCALCHSDDACRKCHQLMRPENHTGFWKTRGHGIKALARRESCVYCHTEVFCIRCHKNTRPINHAGNWKFNHGNTIAGVHVERCSVCHPRIITKVSFPGDPKCNPCHP